MSNGSRDISLKSVQIVKSQFPFMTGSLIWNQCGDPRPREMLWVSAAAAGTAGPEDASLQIRDAPWGSKLPFIATAMILLRGTPYTNTHGTPRTLFRRITYSGDTAECPILAISQVQVGNIARISKLSGGISYNYLNSNNSPSHFQGWPRCFFSLSSSLASIQHLKGKLQY